MRVGDPQVVMQFGGGRASRDGLFIGLNRGVMIPTQGIGEAEIVQDAWLPRTESQRRFIRSDGLGVTLLMVIRETEQIVGQPAGGVECDGLGERLLGLSQLALEQVDMSDSLMRRR